MKAHPWTSCSIFATKAARTVPCWCCAWEHFDFDGAGGALPLCGVNSWPGKGIPLSFTTLHYCCPLVCTDGMNIFLNFANSITSSLLIISLGYTEPRTAHKPFGSTYRILSSIRMAFHYMDKDRMIKILASMIHPRLEYAAVVWSPNMSTSCYLLESFVMMFSIPSLA